MTIYDKGENVNITAIDGQVVSGISLGVIDAVWERNRKPEPTLRVEQEDTITAIQIKNIRG